MKNERVVKTGSRTGSATKVKVKVETVAQAFLELLSLRGIDYFFGNAGTDFASIVDAFALRQRQGKESPRPMLIPHEIPLMCMAHGYYLATGKPQMAMVHVGIGTANALGALMGASRGRIPVLLSAGRTPITEEGNPASRNVYIHWGQESFDQASMVREYVKWDYELRDPSQLELAVDRALAMAMTEPRGPGRKSCSTRSESKCTASLPRSKPPCPYSSAVAAGATSGATSGARVPAGIGIFSSPLVCIASA